MALNKSPILPTIFNCKICDYNTSNKKDYNKHLLTRKHMNRTKMNNLEPSDHVQHKYICKICNKGYNARNSLWYHEIKCKKSHTILENTPQYDDTSIEPNKNVIQLLIHENKELINENKDFKNMILELVKSNTELQKQMIDVCKNNNTIINSNNINTTNNKTFNLHVFLNEECKDAMNMSEFINSIQLKLSDLENIGNQGYIEGVSNILINHLNNTEMYKRPVHCSDAKRETLYVKEENKWEKEGPDNKKMKRAVLGLEKKNFLMLNQWKEKYPKCMDSESTQSDAYMKIISKVMNGDEDNINKVIKKVAKEVVIEK